MCVCDSSSLSYAMRKSFNRFVHTNARNESIPRLRQSLLALYNKNISPKLLSDKKINPGVEQPFSQRAMHIIYRGIQRGTVLRHRHTHILTCAVESSRGRVVDIRFEFN